ncbi:hypothetical protein CPC08DRAFT_716515 [Agrocybe pediades]|nr:hypothetical protein CPC08DRAFT_716515 [Agrocybe pediades]
MTELALNKASDALDWIRDLDILLQCTVDRSSSRSIKPLCARMCVTTHRMHPVSGVRISLSEDIQVKRFGRTQLYLHSNIQHMAWSYKPKTLPIPPTSEAHHLRALEMRMMIPTTCGGC